MLLEERIIDDGIFHIKSQDDYFNKFKVLYEWLLISSSSSIL